MRITRPTITLAGMVLWLGSLTPSSALVITQLYLGGNDFVTLRNDDFQTVDLDGYSLRIRNSAQDNIDFELPAGLLDAGEQISVIELPLPGYDIDAQQELLWTESSDLSIALVDPASAVIDFVAVGTKTIDPPSGVSFAPGPIDLTGFDDMSDAVHRTSSVGAPPSFFASDWSIAPSTGPALGTLTPAPIFADGFESGDVSAWGQAVPRARGGSAKNELPRLPNAAPRPW